MNKLLEKVSGLIKSRASPKVVFWMTTPLLVSLFALMFSVPMLFLVWLLSVLSGGLSDHTMGIMTSLVIAVSYMLSILCVIKMWKMSREY
jgi:hypothetical protein